MSVCKNMQKFKADPAYGSFKAWLVSCPSRSEIRVFLHAPGHPYYGQPQTARHRDVIPLDHRVTEGCVKLFPCQCRHEINATIACFDNRPFTCHHDAPPNTATRPGRVDEESSNARWIAARGKLCIFARSSTVTPVQRFALAPTSAADDLSVVLHHEIRAVSNELFIDSEHRPKCRIHLRRGVVGSL